jgi:hypothetical protein
MNPRDRIERTRAFFNKPRPGRVPEPSPIEQLIFNRVSQLIPHGSDSKFAVDLGCHWGKYSLKLAESYGAVCGADFAAEALATAIPHSRVTYRQLDVENDPLTFERPVDFFLAVGLFEMIRDPERLFLKLWHAGHANTSMLVVVPNVRHPHFLTFRAALWASRNVFRREGAYLFNNGQTPTSICAIAGKAGFQVVARGGVVSTIPVLVARLPSKLQRLIVATEPYLSFVLPGAYTWMHFRRE